MAACRALSSRSPGHRQQLVGFRSAFAEDVDASRGAPFGGVPAKEVSPAVRYACTDNDDALQFSSADFFFQIFPRVCESILKAR